MKYCSFLICIYTVEYSLIIYWFMWQLRGWLRWGGLCCRKMALPIQMTSGIKYPVFARVCVSVKERPITSTCMFMLVFVCRWSGRFSDLVCPSTGWGSTDLHISLYLTSTSMSSPRQVRSLTAWHTSSHQAQ